MHPVVPTVVDLASFARDLRALQVVCGTALDSSDLLSRVSEQQDLLQSDLDDSYRLPCKLVPVYVRYDLVSSE